MTLGELKKTALKLCEEFSESDTKNFTEDEEMRDKLIPSINGRLLQIHLYAGNQKCWINLTKNGDVALLPRETQDVLEVFSNGKKVDFQKVGEQLFCSTDTDMVSVLGVFGLQIFNEESENFQQIWISKEFESAIPYGVASDLAVSNDFNLTNIYEQKFQTLLQMKKSKVKVVRFVQNI